MQKLPPEMAMVINGKPVSQLSREELLQAITQLGMQHAHLTDVHARFTRMVAAQVADGLSYTLLAAKNGDADARQDLAQFKRFINEVLDSDWSPSRIHRPV